MKVCFEIPTGVTPADIVKYIHDNGKQVRGHMIMKRLKRQLLFYKIETDVYPSLRHKTRWILTRSLLARIRTTPAPAAWTTSITSSRSMDTEPTWSSTKFVR